MKTVIAIDGPAGSGKSTVARMVAEKLGYLHADSGAIYRTLTLAVMESVGSFPDPDAFGIAVQKNMPDFRSLGVNITIETGIQSNRIGNRNVNDLIRTREVTSRIRFIADLKEARDEVNRILRSFAEITPLVADGRDIGTVVFPDTPFKFFLTASPAVRAHRRAQELAAKGVTADPAEIEKEIIKRDKEDENRSFGALKKAENAILIDTSGDNAKVVSGYILSHLQIQF